ncbi:MAG TPA: NAD(P)H-dependent oxidoreductase [Dokdonella sp.]|uniref:FMN-dependent NADH-azoreductase n=1 Tax=Dokdonella sp. TaxID=2291710 RepID=UPI002BB7062C|nr:NAD(P)H-dependent oxidoreductase [Dokdonella sp.]HUD43061.1 NAD(P)H-dependent oxidoreductase [Dokdonella sp.]
MNLLHIDSSALGSRSVSRELTAAIVAAFAGRDPDLHVTYRDLAAAPLGDWSPETAADTVLEEFLAADVVVLGAPMYNFGIPSQLKAWIDRICVAGRTFRYEAGGPVGLAGGKRVVIASTRGGLYATGAAAALDFQEPYLRKVLGFIGITDVEVIRAEGLNLDEGHRTQALATAREAVAALPARAA